MSCTDANTENTAGTLENVARPGLLHWDVFVTPGIPIVTPDKPPGVQETLFQAMASTLIYGARDAVLVDAFMTVNQASALADWVAAHGKNLTTIYITRRCASSAASPKPWKSIAPDAPPLVSCPGARTRPSPPRCARRFRHAAPVHVVGRRQGDREGAPEGFAGRSRSLVLHMLADYI